MLAENDLPDATDLHRRVARMVSLGPRPPGSPAHNRFVDELAAELAEVGLDVERITHHFTRWDPSTTGLTLLPRTSGDEPESLPVAGSYPNSGSTPADGVEGPVVHLGRLPIVDLDTTLADIAADIAGLAAHAAALEAGVAAALSAAKAAGKNVEGAIAVVDVPLPRLTLAPFWDLAVSIHDPAGALARDTDYARTWSLFLTVPHLNTFRAAGVVAVVFALDVEADRATGQSLPFGLPYQGLPALHVDRETGDRLRLAADGDRQVRLTLAAQRVVDTPSDSLIAVAPGRSSDSDGRVLLVHTHTDGQNAFEENGAVAALVLARVLLAAPLRHAVVFSFVTGHFVDELPETAGLIAAHPELIDTVLAALAIEHVGASGVEPALLFHTAPQLAEPAIAALQHVDLRHTLLCRPFGPMFFGVGLGLGLAGIPTLAYLAGPDCLLSLDGTSGHLNRFDAERMRIELQFALDVLRRLDDAD